MKTRKNIARLLSFLMVLSLLLGISAAPVYAVGGEGETASFEIREANGQTGTVQYKLDNGEFTVADSTPVNLNGVSSITIKATPVADAQVNQSNSGITGTEQAVSFDYAALTNESGWTYQIQDNDGNITFTIEFDNHDGTGGGGNPQQPGPSIAFSADSSIEGGTLAVNNGIFTLSKDGSDLGTFRVTLVDSASQETAYTGNEEIILLNDISSVKIVMTPAEGMKANLITGGDTPVGALSEPVFNDAGNTYTYTAYPSQFGGEQQFLGVSVWFGDEFVVGGGDAPVIWDGPQVEHQSDHGSISVKSIEIGSKTYTYQGEGKFAHNGVVNEQLEWYGYNKTSIAEEGGIRVYGNVFTEENVGVFYINFEFKPDYGYQATHIRTTEDDPIPLSDAGFNAAEAISTFRFAVYPDAHTHFSVVFTATEDIVKANAASISEGSVELASGELDGGSAVLEVNEANITNQGDFEAAAEGLVVSEYLDISLHNVFHKGNAEDVWSTPVENLDNPAEITLRLEDGIDTENVKIVHEKDNGEFEVLPADYNPETQEITFSTSSFSNYAIAYEEQTQDRYLIDFTNAPWTVDGVEVDLEGREPGAELMVWITTEDVIPLTNFDPDTMDAVLIVDENVTLRLNVDENGNTRLADVDGGVEVLPPYGATLTFAVVAKPGNMEIVDKTEENACNADLAELTDDLISKLLTDAEKTRLENGEEVKVWLEATDISASVSQTDKDLIDSKKGNATIGMYLDIDLLKQIGSDSPVNITETNGAVTITLKVPSSLINSNSSVTRTYQMIRVHNGVATVIPCTYNAANQTISCETDQFSTYALAYVDQQNNSGGGNTGGGSTGSPETGDNGNLGLWMILLVLSSCSMIALLVIDKKKKIAK